VSHFDTATILWLFFIMNNQILEKRRAQILLVIREMRRTLGRTPTPRDWPNRPSLATVMRYFGTWHDLIGAAFPRSGDEMTTVNCGVQSTISNWFHAHYEGAAESSACAVSSFRLSDLVLYRPPPQLRSQTGKMSGTEIREHLASEQLLTRCLGLREALRIQECVSSAEFKRMFPTPRIAIACWRDVLKSKSSGECVAPVIYSEQLDERIKVDFVELRSELPLLFPAALIPAAHPS
jgi:hypothetical protein